MVWLSDPTLSVVDEALAAASAVPPPPVSFVEPDYGTDWASVDAGMLGAFSPGYMYEDGSLSGGGDVFGAGLQNPWEPGWQIPPGYESPNVIDMRGADPYAGGAPSSMGGNFLYNGESQDLGMPRGWDTGYDPAVDAAYLGGQQNAFNTAQDTGYFEGPSSGGVLGDWIYQYADWGPQTDRAYFQATLPPENPQDAAQSFLYDPPKIDPNNLDMGDWGWLGPAARTLDKYVLQPLDFVSEVGADWTPNLLRTHPLTMFQANVMDAAARGVNAIGGSLPTLDTPWGSAEKTAADLTDYEGAVSDFRDRPMWQQLLAGTVYDPTAFIPGLGASDEVTDALRGLRGNVDDLFQSARPYADDLLRTVDDELGAVQIGRTTPLRAGDIVRDAAGQEFTVAKNFDGTINGWVTVVDDTTEKGTRRIKRGMLDNSPVGGVADALLEPTGIDELDRAAFRVTAKDAAGPTVIEAPGAKLTREGDEWVSVIEGVPYRGDSPEGVVRQIWADSDEMVNRNRAAGRGWYGGSILEPASETEAKQALLRQTIASERQAAAAPHPGFPQTSEQPFRARIVSVESPSKTTRMFTVEDTATGQTYRIGGYADSAFTKAAQPGMEVDAVYKPRYQNAAFKGMPESPSASAIAPAPSLSTAAPPPRVPPAADAGLSNDELWDSAVAKITESARKSANMYRTGLAQDQLRAGRANQFGNIRDTIRTGSGSAEDLAKAARASASGKFDFAKVQAVELTQGERNAIFLRINDDIAKGTRSPADIFRVTGQDGILAKIEDGRRLQPNELRWVRENLNPELAEVLSERQPTAAQIARELRKEQRELYRTEQQQAKALQKAQARAEREYQRELAKRQTAVDKREMTARWERIAAENDVAEIRQALDSPFLTPEEREIAVRVLRDKADSELRSEGVALRRASGEENRLLRDADRAAARAEKERAELAARAERERVNLSMRAIGQAQREAADAFDRAIRQGRKEVAQFRNQQARMADDLISATERSRWKAIADRFDPDEYTRFIDEATPEEKALGTKYINAQIERAQRAAGRATEDIWKAVEKANPQAEVVRRKALDIIKKKVDDPKLAGELERTVALWLDQSRPLLDAIGEQRLQFLKARIADITGDVGDSYLTALLHRREFLRSGLEQQGLDPDIAKKVAKTLMESELQRRYKAQGGVPQRLLDMLDETKADISSRGYKIASGAAELTQALKNTQFGIGDIAVMGQQGLKAVQTSWPQMMAGLANRILNTMHLGIDTRLIPDNEIARKVQYTLDGLAPQGARTGISDYSKEGTLLSAIPGPTRWLDQKVVVPAADWLNKVQFDYILGNLRSLNYEGNLVLAHLARQDITDPKVRATAAGFANAATSFSPRALDATRAEVEKAVLLSASMRRAQTGVIARVARGLTVGSPTERMLAATSIAAWAGSVLVAGKLVNDYFGIGEFEWDPSKPGFGRITTRFTNGKGQHIVIDLFPQEQVAKAIARSVRALGEGDPALAAKAWGDLGVMSLSPVARPVLAGAAGTGYDPGRGVRYGDVNEGLGVGGKLLNMAPIPPFFESLVTESLPLGARAAEFTGFNTYVESEFTSFNRKVEDAYGKPYRDLEPYQKKEADERFGKPQSTVPEIREQQTIAAEVRDRNIREQQQSDQWLEAGQKADGTPYTAEQWRNDRKMRNEILSRELDIIYRDMPAKADKDKTPLDRYYDAIQAARTPEGAPDWDKVDAYLAGIPQADRDYIARNTGLNDTTLERQYREDVKRIADSGYFDLTEGKREFREQNPEIAELVRRWGYSAASIRAEDITKQFASEQAASDEMLASRQLSPEQWRDDYHVRLAELRGHKDEIYAGFKEDGEPTDALDRWFKQMDALQTPDGKPDWDAIDRWVAQQPAADQAQIDAYTGTALTPKVAEYRADMKAIGDTGYWDMRDQTWGAITRSVPGLAKFETMDDWKDSIVAQIEPQLVKAGVPAALARLQAEQYTDNIQLVSDINKVYKEAFLYPWVIKNPALALSLIEWGYYTPDETMKEFLVLWGQYNR